ncbi:MAG: RNA-binding S4 domain-containing protein [Bacteroidales bacterium]|nr:RNA-binding S4 domain-containing protein [Bacteroidales bacterium]
MDSVRIDKYLWSIRAYKTRSEATTACRGGKVRVNGADAKPSKEVKIGDVITVRKGPATYTYKVMELVQKRQGAKNVAAFAENLTPQSELDKLARPVETIAFRRDPGAGRPTKKDRRLLDALVAGVDMDWAYEPDGEQEETLSGSGLNAKGARRGERASEREGGDENAPAREFDEDAWLEELEDELAEWDENLKDFDEDEY